MVALHDFLYHWQQMQHLNTWKRMEMDVFKENPNYQYQPLQCQIQVKESAVGVWTMRMLRR